MFEKIDDTLSLSVIIFLGKNSGIESVELTGRGRLKGSSRQTRVVLSQSE